MRGGGGGLNPMSSTPKPRTRSQFVKYWQNVHNDMKKKKNDVEFLRNEKPNLKNGSPLKVVSVNSDNKGVNRGRGRPCKMPSVNLEKHFDSSNSVSNDDETTSDEDDVKFLRNEKLDLKNGSPSKVVNVKSDNKGVNRGRGRPCKKPSLNLEQLSDSSNSVSDDDETTSDDDDDDDDDDEFSDEDYRVLSSESSDASYDDEKVITDGDKMVKEEIESGDETDYVVSIDKDDFVSAVRKSKRMREKKESEDEEKIEGGLFQTNRKKDTDYVVNIDKADFLSAVRMSKRMREKKESEDEEKREGALFKTNRKKDTDYAVNIDKDDFLSAVRMSKRMREKKESEDEEKIEGGLFKMNRKKDCEPSYYGCTEKARKNIDEKNNGKEDDKCYNPSAFFQTKDIKSKLNKESKLSEKKTVRARTLDLIKVLVESINSLKEHNSQDYGLTRSALPLRFSFEDEMPKPHVKSDWEMEIDSLFRELELGLLESDEFDRTDSYVVENDVIDTAIDQSPAACCARGEHDPIIDEQIGIVCNYCFTVILDIKYVLPSFYTPPPGRFDHRKEPDEAERYSVDPIRFRDKDHGAPNYTHRVQGTVWDLIPGVENELYPHQREGFEFMWNNIAGSIIIDQMKRPLTGGNGCIISHAPGTGKTRLTIVFLQTFLIMNPACRPVIIAPKGMLLTWEAEFIKWKVNIPFHNLNKKELSENENVFAAEKLGQVLGGTGPMNVDCNRLVKLASWMCGGCILGVSYQLFTNLVRDDREEENGLQGQMRKLLLESPGLLVLDEGHMPRNDNSKIWKALSKVSTQRRIILSGTPFQNNLDELFNTLCVVNPKFALGIESETKMSLKSRRVGRKKWKNLTSSIRTDEDEGLKKLRAMLDPLVHVHKGTILKESLPGLRDTLVFLHPTELQKELLEASSKIRSILRRIHQVSLVSVHPSLMSVAKVPLPDQKINLEGIESADAGVKTTFVLKLIRLADVLGERVLVFSQFIHPLEFIKKQIKSRFSWNEGREVLYMDGQLDARQRQDSISSFNDERSKAKVLLASERACSEGINLVGASRVILLDTVWNPSVEKQAVSRAYRLGQKKIVYVYRLFTSGVEVGQYAQQIEKERMSQLLFSPTEDGESWEGDETVEESEDKILEAMLGLERFGSIFERIIRQPKESDLIEIFGLVDRN